MADVPFYAPIEEPITGGSGGTGAPAPASYADIAAFGEAYRAAFEAGLSQAQAIGASAAYSGSAAQPPIYTPTPGPVPPSVSAQLGEPSVGSPSWAPTGLGAIFGGSIFSTRRRVPTRLGRDLTRLVRVLGETMVRGLRYSLGTPRPPLPSGELPGTGLRVFRPYTGGQIGLGAMISAATVGTLAMLYPRPIGTERILPSERTGGGPPRASGITFVGPLQSMIVPTTGEQELGLGAMVPSLGPSPFNLPPPPRSSSWRQRFEERLRRRVQESKRQLEQRLGVPPTPRPFVPPDAAMQNQPDAYQTGPQFPPQPAATKNRHVGARIGMGIGSIVAGQIIGNLVGGSRARPPTIAPAPISTPTPGLGTPPQPALLLTAVGTGAVGYGTTGGCTCRRRGKARKCLERGSVAWRSGRYKGKAAGQKCIRFAN